MHQCPAVNYGAYADATTPIGTTITAIAGLTFNLAVGMWIFEARIPIVNVGAPTQTTFTVSPAAGPVCSALAYEIRRNAVNAAPLTSGHSALNTASVGTVASAIACVIEGMAVVTTAGTLSISATRTGGTSSTSQVGAYLRAHKVA